MIRSDASSLPHELHGVLTSVMMEAHPRATELLEIVSSFVSIFVVFETKHCCLRGIKNQFPYQSFPIFDIARVRCCMTHDYSGHTSHLYLARAMVLLFQSSLIVGFRPVDIA